MESLDRQLHDFRLTTAEILYHMPDHPGLLQSFLWQTYDLAPRYPEWSRFAALRKRLDPERRFANAYLDRVLGPVTFDRLRELGRSGEAVDILEREVTERKCTEWPALFASLVQDRRAARVSAPAGDLWISSERLPELRAALGHDLDPDLTHLVRRERRRRPIGLEIGEAQTAGGRRQVKRGASRVPVFSRWMSSPVRS